MKRLTLTVGLAALGLAASGCYKIHLRNGDAAAGRAPIEYEDRWHHGLVWGLVELSGPYDLKKICPGGWSEIYTHTTFLNGFVQAVTGPIYTPQNVTVTCAAAGR